MSRFARSRALLVVVAVSLVAVAALGLRAVQAEPTPDLPPIAPEELVASALRAVAAHTPISGTVETSVDLGLPALPAGTGGPLDALLSDQTFRTWSSPDGVRVAQILPMAERVLVVNRTDLWAWDSDRYTAWHAPVPAPPTTEPKRLPSLGDLTALVGMVLGEVAAYADVGIGEPVSVAGRDAYTLELTPTDGTALVGRIQIAIDAQTRIPLRLRVIPQGTLDPAIETGFTSVDFGPIDAAMFTFEPPPGATVVQLDRADHPTDPGGTPPPMPEVRTFGEGFGLILAVRVDQVPKEVRSLLPYAGPLASADVVERADHAWIVVGAVPPDALAGVEPKLP